MGTQIQEGSPFDAFAIRFPTVVQFPCSVKHARSYTSIVHHQEMGADQVGARVGYLSHNSRSHWRTREPAQPK